VETVSWNDAVEFCRRLSARDGKTYRLPTEAEWESACRAGTTTAYYTGDGEAALGEAGWYAGNSREKTHPVAQKKPNAWGLYDMHGNVWQWCSDWYGDYPQADATDPTGAAQGSSRVVRGGSWNNLTQSCRAAHRSNDAPDDRRHSIGFRVCLGVP
jgi:formylglycine-generating enzyme required for sulfatase activity